jgi:para-nitrobenzyl esterase
MQTPDEFELGEDDPTSEDCLTLNVWTPDSAEGSRPVFVWVHGGAFSWGTARHALYDGRTLAERGDIVVVTIQYRLGSFGWLDVSDVGGSASSANNGLLDMVAALEWVQDNAAAFGGDPDNVTLAGESAGGTSLGSLLTSDEAAGLFDRAILQSGSSGLVMTKDVSTEVAADFMAHAEATTISDLRALTSDELLEAQLSFENESAFADIGFHPVIDGIVVEEAPTVALRDGVASTVPVLIGTNRDESRYWLLYIDYLDRLPLSYSDPWLNAISGGRAAEINDAYLVDRPDLTDGQIGLATAGSSAFTMPAIRLSEALSSHASPVWMYQFTLPSTELDGRLGSPHAMELPFMFFNLHGEEALLNPADNPAGYEELAETMQDAWIAFTRTGNPSTQALGTWPMYDQDNRPTMMLDLDSRLVSDPYSEERTAWGDIPFDGLTPSLIETNPLSHPNTEITLPVIIAVIGPVWTAVIVVVLVTLVAGIATGITWLVRRRRRKGDTP